MLKIHFFHPRLRTREVIILLILRSLIEILVRFQQKHNIKNKNKMMQETEMEVAQG